ncbi:MAG: YtpR family tRNA-binding protein [Sporolactobacillus sp.]
MIFYYNKKGIGDVLIVYMGDSPAAAYERRGKIARIFDRESGQTLGFNFFGAADLLKLNLEDGLIKPDPALNEQLDLALNQSGFTETIADEGKPLIVTGYVKKMKKHPDSDHMHLCTVDVGDERLQIVCGAPNIDEGQHVVVAKVGALMPGGTIIRPAVLRGVASNGMICSARELDLPGAPQKRGILVLAEDTVPGQDFFARVQQA